MSVESSDHIDQNPQQSVELIDPSVLENPDYVQALYDYAELTRDMYDTELLLLNDATIYLIIDLQEETRPIIRDLAAVTLLNNAFVHRLYGRRFFSLCHHIISRCVPEERRALVYDRLHQWLGEIDLVDNPLHARYPQADYQHLLADCQDYCSPESDLHELTFNGYTVDDYCHRYNQIAHQDGDAVTLNTEAADQAIDSPFWRIGTHIDALHEHFNSDLSEKDKRAAVREYFQNARQNIHTHIYSHNELTQLVKVLHNYIHAREGVSEADCNQLEAECVDYFLGNYLGNDNPIIVVDSDENQHSIPSSPEFHTNVLLGSLSASPIKDNMILDSLILQALVEQYRETFLRILSRYMHYHAIHPDEDYGIRLQNIMHALHMRFGSAELRKLFLELWEMQDPLVAQTVDANRLVINGTAQGFMNLNLPYNAAFVLASGSYNNIYERLTDEDGLPSQRFQAVIEGMKRLNPLVDTFCRRHEPVFRNVVFNGLEPKFPGDFFWEHIDIDNASNEYVTNMTVVEGRRRALLYELAAYLFFSTRSALEPNAYTLVQSTLRHFSETAPDWIEDVKRLFILCVRERHHDAIEPSLMFSAVENQLAGFSGSGVSLADLYEYTDPANPLPDDWSYSQAYIEKMLHLIDGFLGHIPPDESGSVAVMSTWLDYYENAGDNYRVLDYPPLESVTQLDLLTQQMFPDMDVSIDSRDPFFNKTAAESFANNPCSSPEEKIYDVLTYYARDLLTQEPSERRLGLTFETVINVLIERYPDEVLYVLPNLLRASTRLESEDLIEAYAFIALNQLALLYQRYPDRVRGLLRDLFTDLVDYDLHGNLIFAHESDTQRAVSIVNIWLDQLADSSLEGIMESTFSVLVIHRERSQFGMVREFDTKAEYSRELRPHCEYLFRQFPVFRERDSYFMASVRNAIRTFPPEHFEHHQQAATRRIEIHDRLKYPPFALEQSQELEIFEARYLDHLSAMNLCFGLAYCAYYNASHLRDVFECALSDKLISLSNPPAVENIIRVFAQQLIQRWPYDDNFPFYTRITEMIRNVSERLFQQGTEIITPYFVETVSNNGAIEGVEPHSLETYSQIFQNYFSGDLETEGQSEVLDYFAVLISRVFTRNTPSQALQQFTEQLEEWSAHDADYTIATFDDLILIHTQLQQLIEKANVERHSAELLRIGFSRIEEIVLPVLIEAYVAGISGNYLGRLCFILFPSHPNIAELQLSVLQAFVQRFPQQFDENFALSIQYALIAGHLEALPTAFSLYCDLFTAEQFASFCEEYFLHSECTTFHPLAPGGQENLNDLIAFINGRQDLEPLLHSVLQHIAHEQITSI